MNLRTIEFEELQAKHRTLRENRALRNIFESAIVGAWKKSTRSDPIEKILLLIIEYTEALKADTQETVFQVEEETPVDKSCSVPNP